MSVFFHCARCDCQDGPWGQRGGVLYCERCIRVLDREAEKERLPGGEAS